MVGRSWRKSHRRSAVTTLLEAEATESNVAAAAKGARALHIATHGFLVEGKCLAHLRTATAAKGVIGIAYSPLVPIPALGSCGLMLLAGLLAAAMRRQAGENR